MKIIWTLLLVLFTLASGNAYCQESSEVENLLKEAQLLEKKNDIPSAIQLYNQILIMKPHTIVVKKLRGMALLRERDFHKAIVDFNQFILEISNDPEAYYWRGKAYFTGLNGYDRALIDLSKAIELKNDYEVAYFTRARVYEAKGQTEKAITDYSKVIELNSEAADAYNNRGIAYDSQKKFTLALQDYDRAIELNPNLSEVYTNRGVIYRRKKMYKRAIADYTKAIELDPTDAGTYENRGVVFLLDGRRKEARADLSKACELGLCEAYRRAQIGGRFEKKWLFISTLGALSFGNKLSKSDGSKGGSVLLTGEVFAIAKSIKPLKGIGLGTALVEARNSFWTFLPVYVYYPVYSKPKPTTMFVTDRTFLGGLGGSTEKGPTLQSPFLYIFAGGSKWANPSAYFSFGIGGLWHLTFVELSDRGLPVPISFILQVGALRTSDFTADNGALIDREFGFYFSAGVGISAAK